MKNLDVLEHFARCKTVTQAFDLFGKFVFEKGFDKTAYGCLYGNMEVLPGLGPGVAVNLPSEWVERYANHKYFEFDPVVTQTPFMSQPYRWSDLTGLDDRQARFLGLASEFGLVDGVSVPIHGPGECYVVSLSRSDKGDDPYELRYAQIAVSLFHGAVRSIVDEDEVEVVEIPTVSAKQMDTAKYLAAGHTARQIADLEGVHIRTIEARLKVIRKAVKARTTGEALVKLSLHGLLN